MTINAWWFGLGFFFSQRAGSGTDAGSFYAAGASGRVPEKIDCRLRSVLAACHGLL